MGAAQSAFNPDRSPQVVVPDGYRTPDWPSLYVPNLDVTTQSLGVFLYDASAIWRFTLYWTLLLVSGTFLVCALIATTNLALSLTVFRPHAPKAIAPYLAPPTPLTSLASPTPHSRVDKGHRAEEYEMRSQDQRQAPPGRTLLTRRKRARPPLWPLVLIPVVAFIISATVSLISATVIGFALAALYSAGGFSMSTWVPFLWAVIVLLILIVSSYSTLTSIL